MTLYPNLTASAGFTFSGLLEVQTFLDVGTCVELLEPMIKMSTSHKNEFNLALNLYLPLKL